MFRKCRPGKQKIIWFFIGWDDIDGLGEGGVHHSTLPPWTDFGFEVLSYY